MKSGKFQGQQDAVGVVMTLVSESRGRSAQHSPIIPKNMICNEDMHEPSRSHQATSVEVYAL
jgi:hypothetical protein